MRWFILASLLTACRPDDVKPGESGETGETGETGGEETGDTAPAEDTLVGAWLSTGDNVSYLLQSFGFTDVTATFNSDGSYEVIGATAGRDYTFTGTFSEDISTTPHTVSLTQDAPYADTAAGIWDVEGTTLTYEVQAASATSCTAPTVEGGFGSTDCSGEDYPENFNVQIFEAQ